MKMSKSLFTGRTASRTKSQTERFRTATWGFTVSHFLVKT